MRDADIGLGQMQADMVAADCFDIRNGAGAPFGFVDAFVAGRAPAGEVVRHIDGVELVAVRPFDSLAQENIESHAVVGDLPALGEIRPDDAVGAVSGQILGHRAGDIGRLDPLKIVGIFEFLQFHAEAQSPAPARRLRARGDGDAGQAVSRRGRHAERGRMGEKIAPRGLPRLQLIDNFGQRGVRFAERFQFGEVVFFGHLSVSSD